MAPKPDRKNSAIRREPSHGNHEPHQQDLDPRNWRGRKTRSLVVLEARVSRPLPALRRSEGKLFRAFLKVDNRCSVCGLDFTPHRADDLPAYLVIVIVVP